MATPRARINLKLRTISRLRPHEETVERLSEALLRRLIRDGVQGDPVVVDEASGTILDGTHRVDALRKAGAEFALDLSRRLWRPPGSTLHVGTGSSRGRARVGRRRFSPSLGWRGAGPLGRRTLSPRPRSALLAAYHGEVFGRETDDLEGDTSTMRTFDRAVARKGLHIGYVDEASVTPGMVQGDDLTLIPPGFGKEDVLRAGAEGRLLPPKVDPSRLSRKAPRGGLPGRGPADREGCARGGPGVEEAPV